MRTGHRLASRDIQRFLLHLHEVEGLSWGTCDTFVNGLRFFYHTTLGRTEWESGVCTGGMAGGAPYDADGGLQSLSGGPLLRETGPGRDVDYASVWVTYKF